LPNMVSLLRASVQALQRAAALPTCGALATVRLVGEGRSVMLQRAAANKFVACHPVLAQQQQRWMSAAKSKMVAPKMVYIGGEEMTSYCMQLIMEKWIKPHVDTTSWEFYDLSCKNRDATGDQVLKDAVEAGARIGAIFKEPTITPSAEQTKSMGLKRQLPSPNGAMRRGWNGVTISRDTIHIKGLKLGYVPWSTWHVCF